MKLGPRRSMLVVLLAAAVLGGCARRGHSDATRVVGVADYRRTLHGPVLLHFSPEQWEEAIVGRKESRDLQEEEAVLVASSMPDVRGGMLVDIPPRCSPGCTPIMRYEEPVLPPAPQARSRPRP